MHILLVNDDGIHASGLRTLCRVLSNEGHTVSVCAPDRERSAASHSASFIRPLRARSATVDGAKVAWEADGTPSDCARLGLYLTRHPGIDMVISGVNRGMNLGGACVYSGTVGAAMEAAMCGVPALASSLCTRNWRSDIDDYTTAARLTERVARWAVAHPLPLGAVYNLNVPTLPYAELKGLVPAKLAPVFLGAPCFERVEDELGVGYQIVSGAFPPMDDPGYDVVRIEQGYATITKLTWDFRLNDDDSDLVEIGL